MNIASGVVIRRGIRRVYHLATELPAYHSLRPSIHSPSPSPSPNPSSALRKGRSEEAHGWSLLNLNFCLVERRKRAESSGKGSYWQGPVEQKQRRVAFSPRLLFIALG